MIADPLEIEIDDDSETGRLLSQADQRPLRLVKGGARYRLAREVHPTDPEPAATAQASDDLERTLELLRASAGTLQGVDVEVLLSDLREQRRQDSTGRPAW
jgi:hypothetical protein